jgi:hypothetical protein
MAAPRPAGHADAGRAAAAAGARRDAPGAGIASGLGDERSLFQNRPPLCHSYIFTESEPKAQTLQGWDEGVSSCRKSTTSWKGGCPSLEDGSWLFENLGLPVGRERPSRQASTVRKGRDRANHAIPGRREPSRPPDSWRTGRETSASDRTVGHTGTRWHQPSNAQGDRVRPGTPGCCR